MFIERRWNPLTTTLLLTALLGCSEGTPTEPPTLDLLGTWHSNSLVYTPVGGGTPAEFLGSGNIVRIIFTFQPDLTYRASTADLRGAVASFTASTGTFTITRGSLLLTPDGASLEPEMLTVEELTATSLTLFTEATTFDFDKDDDDPAVAATLRAVFVKLDTSP